MCSIWNHLAALLAQSPSLSYRQLDGLLRRHPHELRHQAAVQPEGTLVPDDLLEAVEAVGVHELPDVGARPLVLHPGLHQVDRVDGGGARRAGDGAQREAVHGLQDLDQDAAVLGALKIKIDRDQ